MKLIRIVAVALILLLASNLQAGDKTYKLADLASNMKSLEKQEVVLEGTIIGTCKSGCKMWVAGGEYKDGDLYTLVRAKDDAFKFDVRSTGKQAVMKGYAVAEYLDYCAESGKEQKGEMDECATPMDEAKQAKPKLGAKKAELSAKAEEPELKSMTFFATSIEYK